MQTISSIHTHIVQKQTNIAEVSPLEFVLPDTFIDKIHKYIKFINTVDSPLFAISCNEFLTFITYSLHLIHSGLIHKPNPPAARAFNSVRAPTLSPSKHLCEQPEHTTPARGAWVCAHWWPTPLRSARELRLVPRAPTAAAAARACAPAASCSHRQSKAFRPKAIHACAMLASTLLYGLLPVLALLAAAPHPVGPGAHRAPNPRIPCPSHLPHEYHRYEVPKCECQSSADARCTCGIAVVALSIVLSALTAFNVHQLMGSMGGRWGGHGGASATNSLETSIEILWVL